MPDLLELRGKLLHAQAARMDHGIADAGGDEAEKVEMAEHEPSDALGVVPDLGQEAPPVPWPVRA